MGCPNARGAASQSDVQDSFMNSPCAAKQARGSRPSSRRNQAASSGCQNGCKTFQSVHVGGQNSNGGRDFFAEARKVATSRPCHLIGTLPTKRHFITMFT